jgi:hypothetical protein
MFKAFDLWPSRPLSIAALGLSFVTASVLSADFVLAAKQQTFVTADAAVAALVDAVRSEDPSDAIIAVLGPYGDDIVDSGDAVADAARRATFLSSFDERNTVEQVDDSKAVLVIGQDEYPFPIPLMMEDGAWRWDTEAGRDEILTRRIGENELSAIEAVRAYVDAQMEYASKERDGRGIQYARRLLSREGRKDGLYWPATNEDDLSPLGPLVAEAQREGYRATGSENEQPAYHGYVFKLLYGQGRNAPDGARDYIINDRKIGGFALLATPAEYGNSGVMTFIVNHDGVVYQKDLGPDSADIARKIRLFDPDSSWTKTEPQ